MFRKQLSKFFYGDARTHNSLDLTLLKHSRELINSQHSIFAAVDLDCDGLKAGCSVRVILS